jgi:protein tyrosine phosphatase type 4A
MKRYNVTDLVRVCECTYEGADLRNAGIQLHEMAYDDGTSPPKEIISQWLELVRSRFYSKTGKSILIFWQQDRRTAFNILQSKCFLFSYVNTSYFVESTAEKTIAVHCVAGLGRAPVLVAIALIEYAHFDPVDAVSFIRKIRRGSINEKQLQYLEQYSRQQKSGCSCVIL